MLRFPKDFIFLLLFFFLSTCGKSSAGALSLPKYLLFTRSTSPADLSPDFLSQVPKGIGASASPNKDIYIGNEILVSLMNNNNLTASLARLNQLLNSSRVSGVPISICLDGENWWGGKLLNWWNSSRPDYDPSNVNNVEWFGPTNASAVKIGWRSS